MERSRDRKRAARGRRIRPVWSLSWWMVLLIVVAGLGIYALIGRQLIAAIYHSEAPWAEAILSWRATTPVEAYYRHADELALSAAFWTIAIYGVARALFREPIGCVLSAASLAITVFLLFCVFELFPSLIPVFRLDVVSGYYAYKANYLPDPELVFVEKPFNRAFIDNFAGANDAMLYGIDVPRSTIEWVMDEDGFRNPPGRTSADIVLLGDSYLEYGSTQADTFGGRLEAKLGEITVKNLGKSGYAPFQYLAAFKRYGVRHNPRIAIMAIYEGNDFKETRDFLTWKSGYPNRAEGFLFRFSTDSFFARFRAALAATYAGARQAVANLAKSFLQAIARRRGYHFRVHPDLAIIDLNGKKHPKLFIDKFTPEKDDQLLERREFAALRQVFAEFEAACEARRIVPLVLYIPTAAHVYAAYSTSDSGSSWLSEREIQIQFSDETERAVSALARQAGISFLSLTPVFRKAAGEGAMVYYALDAHWNEHGRELAARFVAQTLRERYLRTNKNAENAARGKKRAAL